jgi:N4-gp56 family major capsid protein
MADSTISTVGYPGSGTFTGGSLGALVQTYYNKKAQDRLFQNLVFYSLPEKKRLPKNNGQIMQFFRYDNIASSTVSGAISEVTTTANQSQLSAQVVNLTTSIYGTYVTLSKYAVDTTRSGQLVEDAINVLSDTASDIVDLLIKSTLTSNATAYYGTGLAKTTASITTADTMTASTLKLVVRGLQSDKVRPFADGQKYAGIIHPRHWYDIQTDTTVGGFSATAQYSEPKKIWNGEIGSIAGVRLVLSQNLSQVTSTAAITSSVTGVAYESFFVGEGALACVSLEDNPIQIITKGEGGSYDPYSNLVTVAAKLPGFGVAWLGDDATNKRAYRVVTATTA